MEKITLTLPPQSLRAYKRVNLKREDGSPIDPFWDFKLSAVPPNDWDASQCEFTGRDTSPEFRKALAGLKVKAAVSANNEPYISFGLVRLTVEVASITTFTRKDGSKGVSFRVTPLIVERVEDNSTAEFDAMAK